jgi:hypothetical protein
MELHSIIKKCITHNIGANTKFQKVGNVFLNVQQMVTQLIAYLVLFLSLNHSSQTFQLINTFHFKECAFVLKSQFALNELEPNTIGIMCSLIIDKYINCRNQYESLSLIYIYIYI